MSKDSMFSKPLWYGELETFNPKKYSLSSRDTLNGIINLHFLLTKKEDYFDYDTLVYSYTIPKPGSNFFSYSKIIDTIHGYKLSEINGVGKRFEFQGHDIPIRTFEISANFADTIVASEKDTLKILINRLVEFVKLDKK